MVTSARILIVDDDPRICRLLTRYLGQEGYSVRAAFNGNEMRQLVAAEQPDLVILDWILPDEDGLTLARELRSQSDVAIIMLTGKTETVDRVVGLELGADDYVTKPFEERELRARIRTVLRRTSQNKPPDSSTKGSVAHFAGWQFDLAAYTLTSPAGERIHLTSHEFQLLSALVTQCNRVLTRSKILELVAGRDWSPYDRSIDVLVGKLRGKIEDNPRQPNFIQTVRGIGYKFSARVEFRERTNSMAGA